MDTISSKGTIANFCNQAITAYNQSGAEACAAVLLNHVLNKKVRFPLLEHGARLLTAAIPEAGMLTVTDHVTAAHTIGGNLIAGIVLQEQLPIAPRTCFDKAEAYIIDGDEWYVCDIIGERVFGHALLTLPHLTLPVLRSLATHPNPWMVRVIGVAGHYAIKKGLTKAKVEELFQLLLSLAAAPGFHTKKGIGWAAKTTAKFHPEIIARHQQQIADPELVQQWFRTKIDIGLSRTYKYAHRHTS